MASETAKVQATANATTAPPFSSYHIKNTTINEGPGVKLSTDQKLIVGSVLDLFEGNPTLKNLSLWSKDGTFADPLAVATGYDRFAAQWYGLVALFHPIRIQSHTVISGGNPIELNLSNKYVVKGIKKEQIIDSVVRIHVGSDGKIDKVEDKWNGKLPEGGVSEVSWPIGLIPISIARKAAVEGIAWSWWSFCTLSWWWPFLVFRKLNAVTVPTFVKVPKTEEEDMKMKAEREKES